MFLQISLHLYDTRRRVALVPSQVFTCDSSQASVCHVRHITVNTCRRTYLNLIRAGVGKIGISTVSIIIIIALHKQYPKMFYCYPRRTSILMSAICGPLSAFNNAGTTTLYRYALLIIGNYYKIPTMIWFLLNRVKK